MTPTSPSKEVALADELDAWPATGRGDGLDAAVVSRLMKQAAAALRASAPAVGIREALEPFISKIQWPMNGLADTDVVQCNVITPDYETGGTKRAFFGLLVSDFKRLAEAATLASVQPPGEGVREALEQARDALIKIRKCSIAGCEEGYGKPEKWADDLFRSHGDVAAALKTIDAALRVQTPAGEGAREAALASAAQDFVDKVDRGEARSKQSYAAFKAALASLPPVSGDKR